jgi:hypothetical protein
MTELKPRNILAAKEHIERKKIGQDEQDLQGERHLFPNKIPKYFYTNSTN